MATASDDELLAACLRGEAAGWEALLERYAALIYSIPLRYRLSEADAADVFQTVCVTLLERLDTIRAPRGLAAWLITTTSRQSLAVARRRRREEIIPTGAESALVDPEELPEDELLALERRHVVRAAVAQLTDRCRRLIEGLFFNASERGAYQRLAASLEVPMNSLGPTRARCLERLRQLLVAQGYEFRR